MLSLPCVGDPTACGAWPRTWKSALDHGVGDGAHPSPSRGWRVERLLRPTALRQHWGLAQQVGGCPGSWRALRPEGTWQRAERPKLRPSFPVTRPLQELWRKREVGKAHVWGTDIWLEAQVTS